VKIVIINGPNLNLLGKREPEKYGYQAFEDYYKELAAFYPAISFEYFQSNSEGELIDKLHQVGFDAQGIILNAAAYGHTSIALADAVAAIKTPVVEVHITNVHAREAFRHESYLTKYCIGLISGFGTDSYRLAVEAHLRRLK
jgi:3-dehydroquinate dehydratase II